MSKTSLFRRRDHPKQNKISGQSNLIHSIVSGEFMLSPDRTGILCLMQSSFKSRKSEFKRRFSLVKTATISAFRVISFSKALTLSMNKISTEKERSHPFYWAPFVIVGLGDSIKFN